MGTFSLEPASTSVFQTLHALLDLQGLGSVRPHGDIGINRVRDGQRCHPGGNGYDTVLRLLGMGTQTDVRQLGQRIFSRAGQRDHLRAAVLRDLGAVHHAAGAAGVADGKHRVPLIQIIAGDHLQMGIRIYRRVQAKPQQFMVQIHRHRRGAAQSENYDFPGIHQHLRRRGQCLRLQHIPGKLQGQHGALEHLVPDRLDGIPGADLLMGMISSGETVAWASVSFRSS